MAQMTLEDATTFMGILRHAKLFLTYIPLIIVDGQVEWIVILLKCMLITLR